MTDKKVRKSKNSISTPSYFIKRLKDNKFVTYRIFSEYALIDPRRWTILVEPGTASIYITCFENRGFAGDIMFEFNDGGVLFPRNYSIKTDSIEVIVTHLLEKGVTPTANKINEHK